MGLVGGWFGREDTRDYWPQGAGSITLGPVDLSALKRPSLSFSSYYDTENEAGRDVKSVRIYTPQSAPNQHLWAFAREITLSSHNGGYKHWQTVTVPLDDLANKPVKVEFSFNAGSAENNLYLGWMIDNVVIGHDADKDGLPDTLEKNRQDLRISTQIAPIPIPDASIGKSWVRRLDRPFGKNLTLDGTVKHPNINTLKVWLGVEATHTLPEQSRLIFDQGTIITACRPGGFGGFLSGRWVPMAETRNGNALLVSANLTGCGFTRTWTTQHPDWFLKVQDFSADGAIARIETLRVVAGGFTNHLETDTDGDGKSDADELLARTDPLGFDADQDTLHEGPLDPDDTKPQWAPGARISSNDFAHHVDVEFLDVLVTLPGARFETATGTAAPQPASAIRLHGTTWRVVTPSPRPDRLLAHWSDAYGTSGTTTVHLSQPSGVAYGATAIDAKIQTQSNTAVFPVTPFSRSDWAAIAGVAGVVGVAVGTAAAGVVILGTSPVWVPAAGVVAGTAIAVSFVAYVVADAATTETNTCTARFPGFPGGPSYKFTVPPSTPLSGLSHAQALDVVKHACDYANLPGSVTRIFYKNGDVLSTLVIEAGRISAGFRWQLPGAGWGSWGSVENLLKVEAEAAGKLKHAGENEFERRPVAATQKPRSCSPVIVSLESAGTSLSQTRVESAISFCQETLGDLSGSGKAGLRASADEVLIGSLALHLTHDLSRLGLSFHSDHPQVWYYGEPVSSQNQCLSQDGRRRCSTFGTEPWSTSQSVVEATQQAVWKAKWANGKIDSLGSAGLVLPSTPGALTPAKPIDWFARRLNETESGLDLTGLNAGVRTLFLLGGPSGGAGPKANTIVVMHKDLEID